MSSDCSKTRSAGGQLEGPQISHLMFMQGHIVMERAPMLNFKVSDFLEGPHVEFQHELYARTYSEGPQVELQGEF